MRDFALAVVVPCTRLSSELKQISGVPSADLEWWSSSDPIHASTTDDTWFEMTATSSIEIISPSAWHCGHHP